MAGLFHSLNVGSESLYANRQGIDTTAHNIANAQTEGFSRQRVNLTQRDPTAINDLMIGNGVFVGTISRSHDKFVEQQLNISQTSLGQSQARQKAIEDLEAIFSPELSASVSDELDAFFHSMQTLSNFPEELTARTAVKEQGENVAAAFRRVDHEVRRVRDNINEEIKGQLNEVNDLLLNISKMNGKIAGTEVNGTSTANDLRDQRDRMLRRLTELVQVNYYDDQHGMLTIRGPGEVSLVDGKRAATFDILRDQENDGLYKIVSIDSEGSSSREITDYFSGGSISGLLEVRDGISKDLISHNNEMAQTFVNEFNSIHRLGFGLNNFREQSGVDFFSKIEDEKFAARDMFLSEEILNSTDAIATSSTPNTAGDNVNLNRLIEVRRKNLFVETDANINEYYSNYVGILGIEALRSSHLLESDKVLQADWQARRESISGVSLDEEATNLIKWQTAFTASSKVITTVDEMLETVLTLKR